MYKCVAFTCKIKFNRRLTSWETPWYLQKKKKPKQGKPTHYFSAPVYNGVRIQVLNFTNSLVMTRNFHAFYLVGPLQFPFKYVWPGIYWNVWTIFTMGTSNLHAFYEDDFVVFPIFIHNHGHRVIEDLKQIILINKGYMTKLPN